MYHPLVFPTCDNLSNDISKNPGPQFQSNFFNFMSWNLNSIYAFFVYNENADLVYDVIRMRQLSKQTLHELSPNDNS